MNKGCSFESDMSSIDVTAVSKRYITKCVEDRHLLEAATLE